MAFTEFNKKKAYYDSDPQSSAVTPRSPKMMGTEALHVELALNMAKLATGRKTALHLACRETVDKQDTEVLTAPLCLDKIGWFPKLLIHRKVCWVFLAWQRRLMLPWDTYPQ